ncbi:gp53-like domain-containing protein [Escherichia coli]|uniref:gp53-like domain-containing protein n=1 Tax=Escherichia coli TaxID=562 RepID=UPI0027961556|nr:hypothetical protein [Escherichia coli]
MPPVQTPDNLFHDGNPLTGELGTIVDAEHLNNVQGAVRDAQSELITVLNAAGINVDPSKQNQLLTALKALLLSRSNPFGDIKSDGTVKTSLENLGLGDISVAGVATGSMGETGYAIFPMMIGGTRKTFIMQWGTLTLLRSGGTVDINLPIAFPTMVMQAYATHDNVIQTARPTVYAIAPTSRTTITATAMSLRADSVGAAVTRSSDSDLCYGRYLAIGY